MRAAQAAARRRQLTSQKPLLQRFQSMFSLPRILEQNLRPDHMSMAPFFPTSVSFPRGHNLDTTNCVLSPHDHGQQLRSVGVRLWMQGSVELAVRRQHIPPKGYRLLSRKPSHPPRTATRSDASHSLVSRIRVPGVPSMGPARPPWRLATRSRGSAQV